LLKFETLRHSAGVKTNFKIISILFQVQIQTNSKFQISLSVSDSDSDFDCQIANSKPFSLAK